VQGPISRHLLLLINLQQQSTNLRLLLLIGLRKLLPDVETNR